MIPTTSPSSSFAGHVRHNSWQGDRDEQCWNHARSSIHPFLSSIHPSFVSFIHLSSRFHPSIFPPFSSIHPSISCIPHSSPSIYSFLFIYFCSFIHLSRFSIHPSLFILSFFLNPPFFLLLHLSFVYLIFLTRYLFV